MDSNNDLKNRIAMLENQVKQLQKTAISEEERAAIDNMTQLLFGSERLGLKSMRDMVNEMYTNWERAKWILGLVGISSIGTLIGFVLLVRELFGG